MRSNSASADERLAGNFGLDGIQNGTELTQIGNKLDPSTYRLRVQQSLFTKIRVHHDLTRDQMAAKPPSEIQSMIGDPRLVELAYSQSRTYSPKELRQLMQAIRRWGKNS